GQDLRPAIVIKGKDGKVAKLSRGGEARYQLAVDAIISVDPGTHVKAGDVIARLPTESANTRDITRRLPRVAELLWAGRPQGGAEGEGGGGHRRSVGHGALRPRLQEQAVHCHRAPRRRRGGEGVPDPEGQAHPPAGWRRH